MALAILKCDKTTKGSINFKKLKIWWDENCVNRIFMNDFI